MKKVSVIWLADVIAAMAENGQIREEGIEYLADRIGFAISPTNHPENSAKAFKVVVNAERRKYKK